MGKVRPRRNEDVLRSVQMPILVYTIFSSKQRDSVSEVFRFVRLFGQEVSWLDVLALVV